MALPHSKPLDAGTGRVCASFDAHSASWMSIGTPHPRHGFIELADAPSFDETLRGQSSATRAHRAGLADGANAFLVIEVDGSRPRLEPITDDPTAPAWEGNGIRVQTRVQADAGGITQAWDVPPSAVVSIRVRGRLDRPALAMVTETDPPAPTGAVTIRSVDPPWIVLESTSLAARARIRVDGARVEWADADADVCIGQLSWPEGTADRHRCSISVHLEPGLDSEAEASLPRPATGDRLTDRALAYVRGCTALRTGEDERVILTDHRLLPLSWTRDAYWQALCLLASDAPGDRGRVADHLRWLWRRCDRPEGWWARSHHADGRRKDLAFQADQQLYPLLELADYGEVLTALPDGVRWEAAVADAWAAIEARVDDRLGLLASGENAADDPAVAPFIGASQILRWWAAVRMERLTRAGALSLDPKPFRAIAASTRQAFAAAFERDGEAWPYAVDDAGNGLAYHDANDLPVALAPAWGFCTSDDPGWLATMAFAFSRSNPGYVAGRRPGLGSAHTAGPWTLGDVQAWIWARAVGDEIAAGAALARLDEVALADGMLPEAYDPDDGSPIRLWFAWPGAALAALRLLGGGWPASDHAEGRGRIGSGS